MLPVNDLPPIINPLYVLPKTASFLDIPRSLVLTALLSDRLRGRLLSRLPRNKHLKIF